MTAVQAQCPFRIPYFLPFLFSTEDLTEYLEHGTLLDVSTCFEDVLTEALRRLAFSDNHYSHSTGGNRLVVFRLTICSFFFPAKTQTPPLFFHSASLSISFFPSASPPMLYPPFHSSHT